MILNTFIFLGVVLNPIYSIYYYIELFEKEKRLKRLLFEAIMKSLEDDYEHYL